MWLQRSSPLLVSFLLANVPNVLGRNLVPVRPGGSGHVRRDASGLNLKSTETFLWGDIDGNPSLANLTVHMPGEQENIISMEQFDGMTTSVRCNTNNLALTFKDDATFAYAQKVWDWVNGADNHSFVMVAGAGDCGNNTDRIPFVISSMQFDEAANKATLASQKSDWQTVAHSYDLTVGQVSQTPGINKRDFDKSSTIDFVHDFPFQVSLSANGLSATLACTNCSTAGEFDMKFTISTKLLIPTGASMTIKPKGVSAIGQMKLSGSGELTDALTKEFDIISIPIDGIKIPEVLDLGPFLTISVGAELSAVKLTAGVQSGATATISDDAILTVDLLDPSQNQFSGWEPDIEAVDVRVDASISGGVAVFAKAAVELQAEALGHGFAIGLNMKVPNINAKLEAIVSPQGACPAAALAPGVENKQTGVKISTNIGAQLNIQAKKTSDDDPLFTVQIATIDKPIAQTCFPFGDPVAARSLPMTSRHMRGIAAPLK